MHGSGKAGKAGRRKARTSNAAKKRYSDRVYSKYSFLVPRDGGLDQYLREVQGAGESMGDAIRRALVEHIALHKKDEGQDGQDGQDGLGEAQQEA